jgi:hypothetical protein
MNDKELTSEIIKAVVKHIKNNKLTARDICDSLMESYLFFVNYTIDEQHKNHPEMIQLFKKYRKKIITSFDFETDNFLKAAASLINKIEGKPSELN